VETLRFIFPYLRPHWRGYVVGLLLVPFSVAAGLATPYLTGEAVAIFQDPSRHGQGLTAIILWILGLSIAGGLGLFAVRYLIIGASRKMELDLRNHLFRHLQSLDQLYFKNARTGDIMARATSDVESVRTVAGPVIMYTARTVILLAAALPLMISVSWKLTVCIMVPLSLLTVAVRKVGPRVHDAVLKTQETLSELSSTGQENFAGVRVVKSYAQEKPEIQTFNAIAQKYLARNLDVARVQSWMYPIIGGVGDLASISLLFVGGLLIIWGQLGFSDFIKFGGYQTNLLWPMISIGWVANQFHRGSASVQRLQAIFAVESRVKEPVQPQVPDSGAIEGSISIRNLSFGYGSTAVLSDVSIEVPRGKTVAVVGRTGSGKSTLVSLIPRIYPTPDGTVFVDGIDVNRLPLALLRRAIGFVPQESFLFSRTVTENIAFGVEDAEPEDVYAVSEATRFAKDIDQLPRGYEELVGERGVTLSGGQKQRAAISRALLVKLRILILDDALSAVDTQTEEEIFENLKRVTEGLTTFIVSHRISSIRHASRIYVLDAGRVVEEGTHDELLGRQGLYADIYRLQLLSDELERL
jgi:ATP-binding cassette subfamily B multidrug efflux pump